ncbi:tetratricopeptide repeat protein [candidate division WOR-3 bacterium]|nr:tetratricopeptide repeat protein [candidate division WOR-3 bacterium]
MTNERIKELEVKLTELDDKGKQGLKKVDVLNELAFALYSTDLDRTRDYATKAIELAERLEYKKGEARGYRTIGVYFWLKGAFHEALEKTLKSLKISEEAGDEDGCASSLNNMGLINMNLGKPDLALEDHRKASEIFERLGNTESQAKTLTNIGIIYDAQEAYEEALKYFLRGLKLHEEIDNKTVLAGSHSYIGSSYRGKGDYNKALEHYLMAVDISESTGKKLDAAIAYKGIGSLYTKLQQYDQAVDYLEKALDLARQMKSKHQEISVYRYLLEMYEARQDYKTALECLKKVHSLESQIFSEESDAKIARLQVMYETEKKEKEAEIYRLKNVELEEMVARRTAELEELIYVTSHDLRTPLRAISGFSQFLYEDYFDRFDKEGKNYYDLLLKAVTRMERLLDDLLSVNALSRKKVKFSTVPSSKLIKRALEILNPPKDSEVKFDPEELPLLHCDQSKITDVFYHLISNGLKFNKRTHKRIKITARDSGKSHEFAVEDNGIGIEERHYERIFQTFQRLHQLGDYEGTGVGLSMVKRVIVEHGGKIWVESRIGKGSVFRFTLPKKSHQRR